MRHERLALVPLVLLALGFGLSAAAAASAPLTVYVGTYTDTASRGIYRFSFDPATGQASEPVLAGETQNPSFLALHPSGRFLYAVGEVSSFDGKKTGAVSAFAIDPKTGNLTLLNQQSSEGAGPCHLTIDRSGRNLLVANYGGGTVAVLPVGPDGRLSPASSVQAHEGKGPNAGRQDKPHAHGIYLDAQERFALAPDLGADRVFVYRFDAGKHTLAPHGSGVLPPGSGPRHVAFDPKGAHLYAINELLSTVTVFRYDAAAGSLTEVETVPALPAGHTGTSWTAEVAVSGDGRYVYGSNRGHDSLAVYHVAKEGRLELAGHAPVGGKNPRHFAIDPTGAWILVGHQGSDSISVMKVDAKSGIPALTGTPIRVAKPVCILFVPAR
jgi:6-phosphogluconolactonase